MTKQLKLTMAAAAALAAMNVRDAFAMSELDTRPDSLYYNLANELRYQGVGAVNLAFGGSQIQLGSGTLIAPKWVLTAAHVADGVGTLGLPYRFNIGGFKFDNGATYTLATGGRIPHPNWNRNDIFAGYDIGLLKLSSAVGGIIPSSRYTASDLLGQVGTTVGFGIYGTGSNPPDPLEPQDGRKRAGSNMIDIYGMAAYGASDQYLASDFDQEGGVGFNPFGSALPLNNEMCASSGDSGGGLFVDVGPGIPPDDHPRVYAAGVTSFVEDTRQETGGDDSNYGDTFGSTRVSFFNSWVDDQITVKWGNAAGGQFATAANWTTGVLPDTGDVIGLNTAGTYSITFAGNITSDRVIARSGNVTLAMGTRTWTLASETYEGSLIVGRYGGNNAGLTVNNGTLATRDIVIAEQPGATGTLAIASNGVLNVTGDVYVGGSYVAPGGTGTLSLNAGNTTVSGGVKIFPGGTTTLAGGLLTAGSADLLGGTLRASGATVGLSSPITASSAGGTFRADSPMNLNGSLTTAASATLTKTGVAVLTIGGTQTHGANTALVVGAGTLNLDSNAGGAGGASPNLAVVANATTNFGSTQNLRALLVGAGATATLTAGGAKTIKTPVLSVNATGKLNLTDNDLIVDYTGGPGASPIGSWNGSTYTGLTGQIKSGRNGGGWNGNGIITNSASGNLTTLGIAEASQARGLSGGQTTLWSSQTVDAESVLVMFTYGGDATLDGKINVDDYGRIDLNVGLGSSGWFNGDFNYDGKINVDDYGIIDFNVSAQGAPLGTGSSLSGVGAVPEPSIFPFAIGLAWLSRRKRRG